MSYKMSLENNRVFIGNIYYKLTKPELEQIFSKAGRIMKLDLFIDEQGKSRGCGIIHYSTKEEAVNAVKLFNLTQIHDRRITVKEDETFYLQHQKPVQISIRNMPGTVTWQQLKDVCREIGNVLRADVRIQSNNTASGTVLFEKSNDAIRAVQLLNGALFNGIRVEAAFDSIIKL